MGHYATLFSNESWVESRLWLSSNGFRFFKRAEETNIEVIFTPSLIPHILRLGKSNAQPYFVLVVFEAKTWTRGFKARPEFFFSPFFLLALAKTQNGVTAITKPSPYYQKCTNDTKKQEKSRFPISTFCIQIKCLVDRALVFHHINASHARCRYRTWLWTLHAACQSHLCRQTWTLPGWGRAARCGHYPESKAASDCLASGLVAGRQGS